MSTICLADRCTLSNFVVCSTAMWQLGPATTCTSYLGVGVPSPLTLPWTANCPTLLPASDIPPMDSPATLTLQNWSVLPLAVLLGLFASDAKGPSPSATDPNGPGRSDGHGTGPVACTKPLPAANDAGGGDVSIMLAVVAIAVISAGICRPSTDNQSRGGSPGSVPDQGDAVLRSAPKLRGCV